MENTVRTTFPTTTTATDKGAAAQEYAARGWTVAETANGLSNAAIFEQLGDDGILLGERL